LTYWQTPRAKGPGWVSLLLLGTMFLRGLVPAGFMLGPSDGHMAFVVCSAGMPTGHDPAAHTRATHTNPTCPYAESAGPAPLPTFPIVAGAAHVDVLRQAAAVDQTYLGFGPIRQPSSRGPPLVS